MRLVNPWQIELWFEGEIYLKTLKEAKIGETVTVLKLTGNGAVITKGTEIFLRKVAPLGDPLEINVRGYELSLRKADAEMILIG